MTIDIISALSEEAAPTSRTEPCRIQRWLNDIPDDAPGKADLVATLTTTEPKAEHYRPLDALDRLLIRLGLTTSIKSIGLHRTGKCRCHA